MKIIKKTSRLMIIKDRSILVFILGTVFLLLGFLMIFKPILFKESPLWLGIIFFISGGFVIFINKATTINLDKTSNELSFLRKGLTGRSIKKYNLDQIKSIELVASYKTSNGTTKNLYNLVFVFNDNTTVPLGTGGSTTIIMGKQIVPERKIGPRIANFLNVSFEERRPPTLNEILSVVSSSIKHPLKNKWTRKDKSNF